jgi:hypothetical protein
MGQPDADLDRLFLDGCGITDKYRSRHPCFRDSRSCLKDASVGGFGINDTPGFLRGALPET